MHLKRHEASTHLPLPRKGTAYIARAFSHLSSSVPVVIAVRDMLKLAKTAREVKKMIQQKLLKINGKPVKEYRESIRLFNLFEADKSYILTILPTGKFSFEEAKQKDARLVKVINKHLVKGGKIQLNLHDGTNVLSNQNINVGDSLHLSLSGKIVKHITLEKGKEAFVFSGKYQGQKGTISVINGAKVSLNFKGAAATLNGSQIIAQ